VQPSFSAGLALAFTAISALAVPGLASAGQTACIPGRQAAVLVAYDRTGGLAGIQDKLTVRRSGRASYSRLRGSARGTLQLSCTRLRAFRTALVRARFATLAPVYAPDTPLGDGLVESVSYGGRTVRVLTGAEPPPRLARVLALLRDIVSRR
jgi:hypothetical protein